MTKVAIVKTIIANNSNLSAEEIVQLVIAQLGMKRSLARVYVMGHIDAVKSNVVAETAVVYAKTNNKFANDLLARLAKGTPRVSSANEHFSK